MTYSVLTKVTSNDYNNQKFYLYKHGKTSLKNLTKGFAGKLKIILNDYPNVFSETEIIPREDEIKYIKGLNVNGRPRPLDFEFENIQKECPEILLKLEEFGFRISGIDREETVRETFED
jgi:hypothetical protein